MRGYGFHKRRGYGGIKGAQTVVLAIFRALQFGREASQHIKEILTECAEFAKYDINIKKENVINKFDETCQGTVPVALWIIGNSTSFEDAVRKAVSLGADADTLGAIISRMDYGKTTYSIWRIMTKKVGTKVCLIRKKY